MSPVRSYFFFYFLAQGKGGGGGPDLHLYTWYLGGGGLKV